MRTSTTVLAGLMGLVAIMPATAAETESPPNPAKLDVAAGGAEAAPSVGQSTADLAKKLANPIAAMISIPFQLNYDEKVGPKDAGVWRLNVQPVIPFTLNEDWNLISRTVLPVVTQDEMFDGVGSKTGLGDTVQSLFFSPKEPVGGWIWGAGPVFNLPTATDDLLGSEKWGAGPTAVLLRQQNGWTYGILANHIWSFAGNEDRDQLNLTYLQPFLAYTFPTATTLTLSSESTFDWDSNDWTVPVILHASQILRMGKLPVSVGAGIKGYAVSPDGGPEWGARLTFTFLLPR